MADDQIAKQDPAGAMTRPEFVKTGHAGLDHLTKDDIQLPRLSLAQQMSKQLNPGDPLYIEGLRVQQLFNNLTGKVYATPLDFYVIRADKPRWVEFFPREMGGGVKDFNVPANDPRTQFGNAGELPAATKFYDYVIILSPSREMIALSFKSTGLKVARQLNALIAMRDADIYAGKYRMTTAMQTNTKGTFAVMTVKNAGWAESQEELDWLKTKYEAIRDKNVQFEREPGDEDSFGAGETASNEM